MKTWDVSSHNNELPLSPAAISMIVAHKKPQTLQPE